MKRKRKIRELPEEEMEKEGAEETKRTEEAKEGDN